VIAADAATDRTASRIAWSLLAAAIACVAVGGALDIAVRNDPAVHNSGGMVFPLFAILPFAIVGALVCARRPDNRVGRLMLGIGVALALGYLGNGLAAWGLAHSSFPQRVAAAGGWFSTFVWSITLALLLTRLLLLFPDGKLPSPRWRFVSVSQALLVPIVVLLGLEPGPLSDYPALDSPFGVAALSGLMSPLGILARVLVGVALVGSACSVVARFRRSRGIERLQLKWFALSVSTVAATFVAAALASAGPTWLSNFVFLLQVAAICSVPVVVGTAVLRYRLFDIDRVISKALVYGALTVLLAGLYAGLVLAGQALFSTFAGGSNLAIATSTLVVAALFLPLRSRIQRFVDRRFYRRRYDAQRTLEGFGARLREQVDLGSLELDLQTVVIETMQPSHVTLWRNEAVQ
jgi:hypothetical protein